MTTERTNPYQINKLPIKKTLETFVGKMSGGPGNMTFNTQTGNFEGTPAERNPKYPIKVMPTKEILELYLKGLSGPTSVRFNTETGIFEKDPGK